MESDMTMEQCCAMTKYSFSFLFIRGFGKDFILMEIQPDFRANWNSIKIFYKCIFRTHAYTIKTLFCFL